MNEVNTHCFFGRGHGHDSAIIWGVWQGVSGLDSPSKMPRCWSLGHSWSLGQLAQGFHNSSPLSTFHESTDASWLFIDRHLSIFVIVPLGITLLQKNANNSCVSIPMAKVTRFNDIQRNGICYFFESKTCCPTTGPKTYELRCLSK